MRRRDFLALATGALALPAAARAQNAAVPLVGYLSSNAKGSDAKLIRELQRGCRTRALSKARPLKLNFIGAKAVTIDCPARLPSWLRARSM